MDINTLQDLRVVELKKELEVRGLSKSGSKKELVERLRNVSVCILCIFGAFYRGGSPVVQAWPLRAIP